MQGAHEGPVHRESECAFSIRDQHTNGLAVQTEVERLLTCIDMESRPTFSCLLEMADAHSTLLTCPG